MPLTQSREPCEQEPEPDRGSGPLKSPRVQVGGFLKLGLEFRILSVVRVTSRFPDGKS